MRPPTPPTRSTTWSCGRPSSATSSPTPGTSPRRSPAPTAPSARPRSSCSTPTAGSHTTARSTTTPTPTGPQSPTSAKPWTRCSRAAPPPGPRRRRWAARSSGRADPPVAPVAVDERVRPRQVRVDDPPHQDRVVAAVEGGVVGADQQRHAEGQQRRVEGARLVGVVVELERAGLGELPRHLVLRGAQDVDREAGRVDQGVVGVRVAGDADQHEGRVERERRERGGSHPDGLAAVAGGHDGDAAGPARQRVAEPPFRDALQLQLPLLRHPPPPRVDRGPGYRRAPARAPLDFKPT